MTKSIKMLIVLCLTLLPACGQKLGGEIMAVTMENVSDGALEYIAGRKVLFAHMSVGKNILQGIAELQQADPRFEKINVFEFSGESPVENPGIYHFLIGSNSFPEKKVQACRDIMVDGEADMNFDAFIFKYCYVDFKKDTDVEGIFAGYIKLVQQIKNRYPNIKIVHVTVPLTVKYKGIKGLIKFYLFGNHPNEKRSLFNRELLKTFGEEDHIFDLAGLESTDSKGRELYYKSKGHKINYMAEELTDDGGHLNAVGRKKAALSLIRTLARLEENGG